MAFGSGERGEEIFKKELKSPRDDTPNDLLMEVAKGAISLSSKISDPTKVKARAWRGEIRASNAPLVHSKA